MRLRVHAIHNAGQEKPETGIRLKLFTSTLRKHLQPPELQHLFSGGGPEIFKISDNYVDNYRLHRQILQLQKTELSTGKSATHCL